MSTFAPAGDFAAVALLGVDFTCSPSRRKPITVARGRVEGDRVVVDAVDALPTLAAFEQMLRAPGPWLGGFDLPFGLPRAFVDAHGLGSSAAEVIAAVRSRCTSRMAWRAFIDAWGNTQPRGARLLHRRTDTASPVASTSPMQTRYVPVGLMYYEGVSRLIDAGVTLPRRRSRARRARGVSASPRARDRRSPPVQERRRRRPPGGARDDRRDARGRARWFRLRARLQRRAAGIARRRRQRRPARCGALPRAGGDRFAAPRLWRARRCRSGRGLDRGGVTPKRLSAPRRRGSRRASARRSRSSTPATSRARPQPRRCQGPWRARKADAARCRCGRRSPRSPS